jgi:hypothetical protein
VDAEHGNRITHDKDSPLYRLFLTFIADARPASFAHQFDVFEHGLSPFFFILFGVTTIVMN